MDIEGSEMEVLRTIEPWLREEKPDLAVSIYHETAHLYRIPLLINHIVPEYRIFIRHNSNDFTETVCYATIHKKPFMQDESYTDWHEMDDDPATRSVQIGHRGIGRCVGARMSSRRNLFHKPSKAEGERPPAKCFLLMAFFC